MKRSLQVTAPLLASAALALLAGCRKPEMQRCVDENNKVVDDKLCANQPPGQPANLNGQQQPRRDPNGVLIPFILPYHFYYGGYGGYGLGSTVGGGSNTPLSGHTYAGSSGARTGGTSRGGFGSTFSGRGGGSSGGE